MNERLLKTIEKNIIEAIGAFYGPFYDDDKERAESIAKDYSHQIHEFVYSQKKKQTRQKQTRQKKRQQKQTGGLHYLYVQRKPRKQIVLKGKKIVVTGTIDGMTRKQVAQSIKKLGGTLQSGVTKETDVVIKAQKAGKSKIEKAKKYGIKVVPFKQVSHRF